MPCVCNRCKPCAPQLQLLSVTRWRAACIIMLSVIVTMMEWIYTGFIPKKKLSKFRLFHKTWYNACNMARRSNTKVPNYSAQLVKGHNPYCSQRTKDRKCILCDFARHFLNYFLSTVRSWEMQFLTDNEWIYICTSCTVMYAQNHSEKLVINVHNIYKYLHMYDFIEKLLWL